MSFSLHAACHTFLSLLGNPLCWLDISVLLRYCHPNPSKSTASQSTSTLPTQRIVALLLSRLSLRLARLEPGCSTVTENSSPSPHSGSFVYPAALIYKLVKSVSTLTHGSLVLLSTLLSILSPGLFFSDSLSTVSYVLYNFPTAVAKSRVFQQRTEGLFWLQFRLSCSRQYMRLERRL